MRICIEFGLKVQIEWMIGIKKHTQIPQTGVELKHIRIRNHCEVLINRQYKRRCTWRNPSTHTQTHLPNPKYTHTHLLLLLHILLPPVMI